MDPDRASRNFIPISYGTPSLVLGTAGVWVVNRDCEPAEGFDTTIDAVALVNPLADAVTVPLPAVVGVRLDVALPPIGDIGEGGLNEPDTPLTEMLIGFVAVVTRLPLASRIVAVYATAFPVCALVVAGVNASFAAGPGAAATNTMSRK